MNVLLVLPILIPFGTAILSMLAWGVVRVQRTLTVIGMLTLLATGVVLLLVVEREGIQATQIGDWRAPIGITIVADLFSAIMVLITGVVGSAVMIYSLGSMDREREGFGYYPLYSIMIMGVCGAFLTGDMFNLYVWFEVLLISSFVLLALGGERPQLAGAIHYVTMNLLASSLFLATVGLLYSITGTLNMADLALRMDDVQQPGLVTAMAVMFLVAFGIKAGMFPLFFWLPTSYHTPPVSVSAIFAGLLTKVGVYALIRVFTLLFIQDTGFTHTIILVLAGFTMVTGVLGATGEYEFRRILSFHIVSQIGYMLMGLGLFTTLALTGSVFYLVHHIIVKTNLFLVSGVVQRLRGSYQLKQLGGLYKSHPVLGILFMIPALSLAGIPPLSGFWAKFILIRAGLEIESFLIVAVALFVGIWTLYSMIKIWLEAFLKEAPDPEDDPATDADLYPLWLMLVPVLLLGILTVLIGVFAEPVFKISEEAAHQLLNRSEYIEAVLGIRQ